ncbi:MAG TPA: precorrin-6A/cobalt-precorrin-6A reductase, partial [Solirubrobacteraceae bacterium]|nr:precorrin-6A/cobalt-precorrin-6A reductase [Solirubrobacteraceae bacterium]
MSTGRILILGGTAEARELAGELDAAGVPVISSLAGRVGRPRLPPGEVRVGGFGGPEALAGWLHDHGIVAVVDATHPF